MYYHFNLENIVSLCESIQAVGLFPQSNDIFGLDIFGHFGLQRTKQWL